MSRRRNTPLTIRQALAKAKKRGWQDIYKFKNGERLVVRIHYPKPGENPFPKIEVGVLCNNGHDRIERQYHGGCLMHIYRPHFERSETQYIISMHGTSSNSRFDLEQMHELNRAQKKLLSLVQKMQDDVLKQISSSADK